MTITSNEFEVCVSVSYTSGSEAIGFVIKTLTGQWNITRNYNNNNNTACLSLTNGVHQVRVFDWNSDGSVPEKWRKEMNVSIAVSHKSHSSLYATSHISSARTKTTSQISTGNEHFYIVCYCSVCGPLIKTDITYTFIIFHYYSEYDIRSE